MRLTDGDALSVQGAFKAETYEKDGVTKLSLSVIGDHVHALRQPARKKAGIGVQRQEQAWLTLGALHRIEEKIYLASKARNE